MQHGAAFQGRADVARVLLAYRVANTAHKDGYFPVHRACWGNEARHTAALRVFLENGDLHKTTTTNGESVQAICSRSGNGMSIKLVEEWIEKEAMKREL